jgi:SAM-dependent methyltransferase
MEKHKGVERRFYDAEAARSTDAGYGRDFGAASYAPEHRAPYAEFERQIQRVAPPGAVVLDIAAGMGRLSLAGRGQGRTLIATDISYIALNVARRRSMAADTALHLVCADGERLPFRDGTIDVVTSAGALCCFDLEMLSKEVRRVLRGDGSWVIVDSLNENPFYRLHRLIGFIRRRRTARVFLNGPTAASLRRLSRAFRSVDVTYHGVLAFLLPLLKPVLGAERATNVISRADRRLGWLRGWSFKVVIVAQGAR